MRSSLWQRWAVTVLLVAACAACRKEMTADDFEAITTEWVAEGAALSLGKAVRFESPTRDEYRKLLEGICAHYGYDIGDYRRKADQLGKDVARLLEEGLRQAVQELTTP